MAEDTLLPHEQFKFETWQNPLNRGGQHTNGPPPYFYAEHLPTGVCVILPTRTIGGDFKCHKLAMEAIAAIITHPLAERLRI